MPKSQTQKLIERGDRLMGVRTPKKPTKTTAVVLDSRDLQTLKSVAHWRVLQGTDDRASVSSLIREAVSEYIERHGLYGEAYVFNNRDRLGSA